MAIGLLQPGEMGAALGRELRARGHEVLWASEGRSRVTGERAFAAGFHEAAAEVFRRSPRRDPPADGDSLIGLVVAALLAGQRGGPAMG